MSTLRVEPTFAVLLVVATSAFGAVVASLVSAFGVSTLASLVSAFGVATFASFVSAFGAVATVSLGVVLASTALGSTVSTGLFSVPVAATLVLFSFSTTVVIAFSHVLAVAPLPLSVATACAAV